jgi:hypothetical protein
MKTQTAITTQQGPVALARLNDIMTQAAQAANEAGASLASDRLNDWKGC